MASGSVRLPVNNYSCSYGQEFPEIFMIAKNIGFIGAGQMAKALAGGWVNAKLVSANQIRAYDPNAESLQSIATAAMGLKSCSSNLEVVEQADVVVLAVKPQLVTTVLTALAKDLQKWPQNKSLPLFVSIAAGCTIARLKNELPGSRWIRVMPNTPCLVGESASAFATDVEITPEETALVKTLLEGVGTAWQLPEKLLDAVTGLSGSGPAYAYVMIEALSDGGVKMGLPRDVALALAAQTLRGAATMVLQTGEHPGVLKDRVTSPAGTTIAGLNELEKQGVRGALISAVTAATKRSEELSKS
jgi:pyrroline-5-carboxylate reductase